MANLKNTIINDTGYIQLPSGTTAQRPTGVNGMMRYNTTLNVVEIYNGATSTWNIVASGGYTVDVLIAAGGGGGGGAGNPSYGGGGGGGAGGLRVISNISVSYRTSYTIVVGAGGTGAHSNDGAGSYYFGSNGQDSSAFGYTSTGGGHGGTYGLGTANAYGQTGGSGGGSPRDATIGNGSGTAGQGNAGGTAYAGSYASAGGGGGAGGAGYTGGADGSGQTISGTTSAGGVGLAYSWTGTSIYYCGGGGGAFSGNGTGAVGGGGFNDGGGTGGIDSNTTIGTAGLANRGQGGGAGSAWYSTGKPGGSGVVLIRYLGPPIGFGGIITQSGGYTCHQFNGSGVFIA